MNTRSVRSIPPFRAVRKAQGIGLRELSRRSGVDAAHLSRVERGEAGLSVETLGRVARALDLKDLVCLLEPYISGDTRDGK